MTAPIQTQPGPARPLRVLQILEATTGGTRRHLAYLLRQLSDSKQLSLSLIYSPLRDPHFACDLALYRRLGITLHEVPMRREIAPWSDLVAFVRIFGIIRHGHYDVVHAHSSKAGFLGRLAARLAGVRKIVYTPHSFAFQYCPRSLAGMAYRWLERLAGHLNHHLVCVSEGERRVAIQYRITPPERITVIPNAISLEETKPRLAADDIRRQWGLEPGRPVVGMVAQFRPQKGTAHFIQAIPQILQEVPETRFLIVGDGPLLPRAKTLIDALGVGHAVILVGHQEHPPDFYQFMDVFVLSSLWEGLPYVIMEAMAMGLPIVATNIAGNNELVTLGVNGFLVPEMNSEQIADSIIRLVQDPALRRCFSEASRCLSATAPTIKDWAGRYSDLYAQAAGRHGVHFLEERSG